MARRYGDYLQRGATVVAIVVDAPGQNAAVVASLALPFPILADPDGAGAIKPFGVWDENRPIARPAVIVLAPDGAEVFRYVGVDFLDRPVEEEALAALDSLALPPRSLPIETVSHVEPAPGPRAMSVRDLSIYLRGVRFATEGLAGRARDQWDAGEAMRTAKMAERFTAALGATRRLTEP